MSEPHALYNKKGHIATITLNRPKAKNAFSPEMITLWREYLEKAKEDDDIRVIVVTGKGDTFCSGGDIRDMAEGKLKSWDMKRFLWDGVHRIVLTLEDLDKPVIAAINGFALGGGLELAMACDFRIASSKAKFGQPEVNLGLIPGYAATQRLSRLTGLGNALYLLMTADMITSDEALRIGLIQKIVEPDQLMEEVMKIARNILAKGPNAVKKIKKVTRQGILMDFEKGCELEAEEFGSLFGKDSEGEEGMKAFLEKRKPNW